MPLTYIEKNVRGVFLECKETIASENVLDYIVGNYQGEEYIRQRYQPTCYLEIDDIQAVIYQENTDTSPEQIEKYGFSAIPNVYGLMSTEALEESGVNRIRRQPGFDLYGQGVLIGFVDTGIDYTHEAFINADNTSRIESLWDQTDEEGDGNEQFPYGRIYEKEELNQALENENPYDVVNVRDENGHGTFLAGVAAGKENREEEFSGVAPLAGLVVVKCKEAKRVYRDYYRIPYEVPAYQENDIMTGIAYILSVAKRQQKRVVICIGMGTNMGSHNGEDNLSSLISRYSSVVGVAIVVSAGNEGNAGHHHRITRREETINIEVEESFDGFMTQLWWLTPGELYLDVISPTGDSFGEMQAISGTRKRKRFLPEQTTVEIYFGVSPELTREQVVVMRFLGVRNGTWKVKVRFGFDNPNFHMWLPISQFLKERVVFLEPEPDVTICNPGNAEDVLTVSAYDVGADSLYLQASRGFTPFSFVKPEIVAPGVGISGTYPRGRYGTMTGTGTAAAFSAGVAALFMQQYSEEALSGIAIREMFIRGAIPRGEPYPNTEWGFGILDAYESIII